MGFGQQDKVKHFVAGSTITTMYNFATYDLTKNRKKAFWYSLGVSTIAGVGKELSDDRFDTKDLAATIAGSLTVNFTIYAITKTKTHRKSKRFHSKMYE